MKMIIYTIERIVFNLKIKWYEWYTVECEHKAWRVRRKQRKTIEKYQKFLEYKKIETYKLEELFYKE